MTMPGRPRANPWPCVSRSMGTGVLSWPRGSSVCSYWVVLITVTAYSCHTTLGLIRKAQGRLDEAEAFYLSALDIITRSQGDVEEKAVALHNYAAVLWDKGNKSDAM